MPPRPARKALNAYHHGDLRDALVQAALQEAERGGPEAINISALAKRLGVSQPAPYKHFADREALLEAVTAEAFRQFNTVLSESRPAEPSKRSKLSRLAQAHAGFRSSPQRNLPPDVRVARPWPMRPEGQRTEQCGDGNLRPAAGSVGGAGGRTTCANASALKIWASLHGVVMLAEQGLLTGEAGHISREELVEEIVEQTKLTLSLAIEAARKAD